MIFRKFSYQIKEQIQIKLIRIKFLSILKILKQKRRLNVNKKKTNLSYDLKDKHNMKIYLK